MIKYLRTTFLLIIFIFSQNQAHSQITIQDLLDKIPAQDAVESELIYNAFLQFGSEGIIKICVLLESQEEGTKAGFAINGLAKHVSRPGFETARLLFSNSILEALDKPLDYETKLFLISQLQITGNDEVVDKLGVFLSDEKLYDPATQALVAIASKKAKEQLLNGLKADNSLNQITLVKALGELRCQEAIPIFQKFSESPNKKLRSVALFALANIGYPDSKELFEKIIQEDSSLNKAEIYSYYHLFSKRLLENGDKYLCVEICETILNSEINEETKSAALSTLVLANGPAALDDLLAVFDTGFDKLQGTAIQLSSQISGEKATKKWLGIIPNSSIDGKVKIMKMLGERGDKTALPELYILLESEKKSIVVAAIPALAKLDGKKVILHFVQLLGQTDDSEKIAQVKETLLLFPTEDLTNPIIKNLLKVTPPAQVALLEILDQRKPQVKTKSIFKLTSSENRKVRTSAIKLLGNLATDKDFSKLVNLLLRSENRTEQTTIQRTFAGFVDQSNNSEKLTNELIKKYQKSRGDQKVLLLQTLGRIGNNFALETIGKEIQNNDEKLKDEAVRVLSNWKNQNAVPALMEIAKTAENENHQILAIRGCVRMIEASDFPDKKKIRLLDELIQAANRPEEKKTALAALGGIKTKESLEVVGKYLKDENLKTEAALAAVKISTPGRNQENEISSSEVALTLVNYDDDPQLQALIENQFSDFSKLNQPPKGFKQLFNGKDLTGWKGLVENPIKRAQMSSGELAEAQVEADQNMSEHWRVEDGILAFDGKGHSLCTAKDYENFEMLVDWKIQKGGDSGIYLKGSPQVQIWDPAQWPEGSGGLYNNQKGARKPLELADNPIGEWSTFRIMMVEGRVTVFLNDVLVVDNVVMENYWERDKPIYPVGQIELQAHSTPLYFRNIFIRELPGKKQLFSGNLFNGKDLSGWKIIGGKEGSWKVENKVLFTDGDGGGWISTEKEFDNFILELEFRVPEGGNSGVMIRAPHFGNPSYTGMEIQVLDDYADQYANLKPWQYTGSVYAVEPASKRVTKKAGQWQKMKIRCEGSIVQVDLNGTQIINTNLISHMDKEAGHPGIKNRKGHIGLQNHSTKIEYKNIKITELE